MPAPIRSVGSRGGLDKHRSGPSPLHPAITLIARLLPKTGWSYHELEAITGVATNTIIRWCDGKNSGTLPNIEAVLNALGYRLTVEPAPEMRARIDEMVRKRRDG
jgi:transcriptional regulator with XRE-family HTH domain